MFSGLVETWAERWTTVNAVERPDQPRYTVGGGSQRLKDTGMLGCIHHVRSAHPAWVGGGSH